MPDTQFILCDDIDYKLEDSCQFAQKGWIKSNGDIAASFIEETFNNLENANTYIGECLDWDTEGKHDFFHYYMAGYNYDYDYNYDFYDYDYGLEESNGEIIRKKRGLAGIEENLKKKKLRGEKKKRRLSRKIGGNNKKDRFGRKTNKRRRNRNGQKKKKISRKNKRRNKKKKTIKKPKKINNIQRKKDEKNKQKKEQLLKKTLKKIGLKSTPTKSVMNKLECIEFAVGKALEECGQKILAAADLPSY